MGAKRRKKGKKNAGVSNALYLGFVAVCVLLITILWPSGATIDAPAPAVETSAPRPENTVSSATPIPSPSPTPSPTPTPVPTPVPTPIAITLSAAGDFTLGGDSRSGSLSAFDSVWKKQGPAYFMENLKAVFEEDDLTIVNLEGPLTAASGGADKEFVFKGRPDYAQILSGGGIEIACLANNHSADYGKQGYQDTQDALDAEDIAYFGYDQVYIAEVKGVKIGFCGYRYTVMDKKEVLRTVESLREECDLVIVSFHWGIELQYEPNADLVEAGHAMIDAGADLVLGHHTHVVGAVEKYKEKYIVYSLGNCCFGGSRNPTDKDAMLFQQTFLLDDFGVSDGGINVIPIRVSSSKNGNNYQPVVLTGSDADRVYEKIEKAGRGLKEAAKVR